MQKKYKDISGVLIRKYRNLFGKYVLEEDGQKTKIYVGKMMFKDVEVGTKWTIGHINGRLINMRPGVHKVSDK